MQRLILPINKAKLTASIDTIAYAQRFGFRHYGADMVSTNGLKTVWCSGNGIVSNVGYDVNCGNVVAIYYPNCFDHYSRSYGDIIIRYFHLDRCYLIDGEKVTRDTKLGEYGHTGKYAGTGAHLHIEADTDIEHPLYTPTLISGSFLRGTSQGAYTYDNQNNTVINPLDLLHVKQTPFDFQKWTTANDQYIRHNDKYLPTY